MINTYSVAFKQCTVDTKMAETAYPFVEELVAASSLGGVLTPLPVTWFRVLRVDARRITVLVELQHAAGYWHILVLGCSLATRTRCVRGNFNLHTFS